MNLLLTKNKLPEIYQTETAECGLACLVMVAQFFRIKITLPQLRNQFSVSLNGLSLKNLIVIAKEVGLGAKPVRCKLEDLADLDQPALLHWDLQHFVVLKCVGQKYVEIHDPSTGYQKMTLADASNHYTGIAVEFFKTDVRSDRSKEDSKYGLGYFLQFFKKLKLDLFQIVLLSVLIELLLLLQPIFLRTALDEEVLLSPSTVDAIFILFFASLLINSAIGYFRDYAVISVGTRFNMTSTKSVFSRMLSLTIPFFEKRQMGDILERYRVMDELENFVVSVIPFAIIDGTMTIVSLALLFYISPEIAVLLLASFLILILIRMFSYTYVKRYEKAFLHAKGEESGFLIETIQNIFTVKVNNLARSRFNAWQGLYSRLVTTQRRMNLNEAQYRTAKVLILGITFLLVVYFLAQQLANELISNAMVIGVIFYYSHFTSRSGALIDRIFDLRMLNVRLERLSDILMANPENQPGDAKNCDVLGRSNTVGGSKEQEDNTEILKFECLNISFKYSPLDDDVLREVSFSMKKGECVALIGENGAGKTTLLKLALGIYSPDSGSVHINGTNIIDLNVDSVRGRFSTVMQNDTFFTGTVAQNIANFSPSIDMALVKECANFAGISDHIEGIPMMYSTMMGNMGASFSAGQMQKIFLARALYRRPDFIFLDEGTANLDSASEDHILNNLKHHKSGKLMIAHRSASIEIADRIILLEGGRLKEL